MKLFSEKFEYIETQEELEKAQEQFSEYGKDYVATACIQERRDWIESMWGDYEKDAEINFRTEIETKGRFNQKTWELYLATFLRSKKLSLLKKTGEGPDFHINLLGKDIWIEATAPTIGEIDPAPERPDLKPGEIHTGGGDMETTYRTKILRFTTAIRNKSSKEKTSQYYKGYKNGLIGENDCYVVAINGYDFCGLVSDPSFLVRRTLFSAGCLSYRRNSDGSLAKGEYLYQPFVLKNKTDGSVEKIPTDIFTNDSYKEISAIIYSPHHIIEGSRDFSKMGDSLTLIRNPFAKNPLPPEFPILGTEWILNGNEISSKIDPNISKYN